jgi:hypothetical protein
MEATTAGPVKSHALAIRDRLPMSAWPNAIVVPLDAKLALSKYARDSAMAFSLCNIAYAII